MMAGQESRISLAEQDEIPSLGENPDEDRKVSVKSHSGKIPTSMDAMVRKEVDQIIEHGDLNASSGHTHSGERHGHAEEPINITQHSTKTLRWIAGFLEEAFGASNTPAFPMFSIPTVPFEERKIVLLDYEVSDFEQPVTYENMSSLSKIFNVNVKFRVGLDPEHRHESFIIKVPPEGKDERELVEMAKSDRREVFCYTRIFTGLKQWCLEQNVEVVFAVPKCYLARHIRKLDPRPLANMIENIPDAESILVFQDLRPAGFGKRHFVEGLSIEEVKAALCEIAKIHGISYALQQRSRAFIAEIFPPLYKPIDVALMYDVLLEDAFPVFINFLRKSKTEAKALSEKIVLLQGRIRGILTELLEPHPPPYPTCLTHMDFWCDNIVFRRKDSWENIPQSWNNAERGSQAESTEDFSRSSTALENNSAPSITGLNTILNNKDETRIHDSALECRILDWQMVSFGRPTHDLAILLLTSLPTETRRKYTNGLLNYYYQVFKSSADIFGAEIYFDAHWLHKEFRKSKVLALLFIIASAELATSDPSTHDRLIDIVSELAAEGRI